jgi:hypothetical protein
VDFKIFSVHQVQIQINIPEDLASTTGDEDFFSLVWNGLIIMREWRSEKYFGGGGVVEVSSISVAT